MLKLEPQTASQAEKTAPARPIRVCFLIDNLRQAGTELRLAKLIQSFDANTVQPYLCLLDGAGEDSRSLEPDNCSIKRLGFRSLHKPASWSRMAEFYRFLKSEEIDVLEIYFRDAMRIGVPLGRLAGVKRVNVTSFNLGYWMNPLDRVFSAVYRNWIDSVITNSQAAKNAAIDNYGKSSEAVLVLENGIDLSPFQQIPTFEKKDFSVTPPRIGMVANLRTVKSPETFLRSAAIVRQQFPQAKFVIAGEGELRSHLEALSAELQLDDALELPGTVTDIPDFLSQLDVAVLCSESEGSSNAVLEYMASGRPIVVTDVGGNKELIRHEEHGLLVDFDSPGQLASGITRMLEHQSFAVRCATSARRQAIEFHSIELTTQRYESFYLDTFQNQKESSSQ